MSDDPHNLTTVIPPHPGTRWQPTTKAEAGADDKRSGKPSTGGREYVRDNDGQFSSTPGSGAKPKPTTGRRAVDLQRRSQKPPKGRAAAKPKKGPKGPNPAKAAERAKRRAEAEARRQQRQQDKLDRAVEADKKKRQQLADREARADQQAKRRAEVEARRAKRDADKLAREAKPKPGGGGKGGSAKPKPKPDAGQDDAKQQAERTANRAKVGKTLGRDLNPLADLADGLQPDKATADSLVAAGLAERQSDGSLTTTASARAMLRAAERGDERQARAFMQRAAELQAQQASREAKRQPKPAAAAPARGQGYGTRFRSFAVFKDRTGRYRWLTISSTAFRDRDGEIVSVKALADDVARTDATGIHGPLRWWHVPGVDIGDCDYAAMDGRCLIESGTFRDERYGAALATTAKDWQISIGFLHGHDQPDARGVFSAIHRFERSIVPAGRASNPFTRLIVKEVQMGLTTEKAQAARELFGDELLQQLLAGVQQTEKAADAAGVAYKSTDAPPVGTVGVWDGEAWVTEKAAPPPEIAAEVDAKAEGDMALMDEEVIEEEVPADEGAASLFTPEELAEIVGVVAPAVAQQVVDALMPALNMEAKMSKWADEIKSSFGGAMAQKDATTAEQAAALAALKAAHEQTAAQVAELTGDQPRAAGFRASQAASTVVNEGHALKDAAPQAVENYVNFFGFGQQPPA